MDTSSEIIHSLLPMFMVSVLGASVFVIGLIEGIAEATASLTKMVSGSLSDQLGRRKPLTVMGYGLAALSKPLFPIANSIAWVFAARFMDRIGKGLRGAPRDALVADISPPHLWGACYGLRQSLDTVGACAGPLLAVALMASFAEDIRKVFWVAVAPACLAVVILVLGVQEPLHAPQRQRARAALDPSALSLLSKSYWWLVLISALLTLARFSEAFLLLRAADTGLSPTLLPLVMVVMNMVYALCAYPAGMLSDRCDRHTVLTMGIAVLLAADGLLAFASGIGSALTGVALWGLHMGLTQGLLITMVADVTPPPLRGTAFGIVHFVSGIALLIASTTAGWLWDHHGPAVTFLAGASFAAGALLGLLSRERVSGARE
jgi:MFS family permease